ncbi:biopolymer transport protein ExbD [Solimonas aquatica]|uniref:Biopolymer transport protein ExbD n=1 Tax=Solimonas aquatica TaxID=489703 RepID=A0A1H9CJ23_9GAMM|nr:biopolymer transporter ExbD [Solimonas aquatica]SEQ01202.1 biopolymer transport protein ExbD [Solimonas aquatica]
MAFGSFHGQRGSAPMAEINVIPLVDIMLVLLVIFIITAPLLTNAVKIDLPRASSNANIGKVDKVQLSIDADGQLYWNGEKLDRAQLQQRLQAAGAQPQPPELHLHADRNTRYEIIAEVMSDAAQRGVAKLGFVTDPPAAAP